MTIFIESGTALSEALRLNMRGLQTDANGSVLGGHSSIFDFDIASTPDTLAISDEIPNLVRGGDPLVCSGAFASSNTAANGLRFTAGTTGETMDLPSDFDLLNLGSTPSFILSTWLTGNAQDANLKAVMGHANGATTYAQWLISSRDATYLVGFSGSLIKIPATTGETDLITIYGRKKTAGQMELTVYKNATVIRKRNVLYPFVDAASNSGTLEMGNITGGFVKSWDGVVHRMQIAKVDPETFDPDAWISEEIANNSSRF